MAIEVAEEHWGGLRFAKPHRAIGVHMRQGQRLGNALGPMIGFPSSTTHRNSQIRRSPVVLMAQSCSARAAASLEVPEQLPPRLTGWRRAVPMSIALVTSDHPRDAPNFWMTKLEAV